MSKSHRASRKVQLSVDEGNNNYVLPVKCSGGSRIFPRRRGGVPTHKLALFGKFFAENCMKMKEFGPWGVRVPGTPLDPPMKWDRPSLKSTRANKTK